MKTPVVFLIYKRPDTTERVFETIRQAKPSKLFVVADGPRAEQTRESEQCAAARAIIEQVDWNCEVFKNYSDVNLGCKQCVSNGLDWVFNTVEEAIILEDDCRADPTFFPFCEELLDYYREDMRVMAISGVNFQFGRQRTEYSYYFSGYPHCWGWATWRRAWQCYDRDMKLWPEIRDGGWLKDLLSDSSTVSCWKKPFQANYDEQIDSWAYRWLFSCWIQNGLAILPNVNLVSNIGFDKNATHTTVKSNFTNVARKKMIFPLQHPPFMLRDTIADDFTLKTHFGFHLAVRIKLIVETHFKTVFNFSRKLNK